VVRLTEAIRQSFNEAEQILAVTHIDPDGDAFGSLTAMGVALTQHGKHFTLLCDDKVPSRFAYLPMSNKIVTNLNAKDGYDLLIAVDCGDEGRLGRTFARLAEPRPKIVNIDHHVTNTRFGDVNLVNENAVSTTEILYQLFCDLGISITPDLALCLLTGLVSDTLGFRTVGVSANTLKIAGELVEAGADLSLVTMQSLNLKPMSTLRLWQIGLDKMRLENGLIWSSISNEERESTGHMSSSTAGLVNLMADVNQAAISAVLLEMSDGSIRVGFRCRPPYNVSDVARSLGGGGHQLASGCTLAGPLDQAEALVVARTKESIRQQEVAFDNGHR
jgi:phosphoesterase RecJ-like protein